MSKNDDDDTMALGIPHPTNPFTNEEADALLETNELRILDSTSEGVNGEID